MKDRLIRIRTLAGALAAVALAACGGGGSSAPATPPPPPPVKVGTFSLAVTNRHVCDFEAVNATYANFRVSKSTALAGPDDPSWVDVPVPARKINLVNLTNGTLEVLAEASLEVGHYTQIGLALDTAGTANTIVPSAGELEQPLEVRAAFASTFVNGGFDVVEGQKTGIVMDVDACRLVSTSEDGTRSFGPGFYPFPAVANGMKGFVSPDALAKHPLVTAQAFGGWIGASARPNPETGEFWLAYLEPGNYVLVVTADNSAASMVDLGRIDATTVKTVSTRESPIPLVPSKMGSISGSLSFPYGGPNGSPINMYAVQECSPNGIGGAVRYNWADVPAYTFTLPNLPRAAALFATYTNTLPLEFTTCSSSLYSVRTFPSALFDNGGVRGVDISTADQTGVKLALIPYGP